MLAKVVFRRSFYLLASLLVMLALINTILMPRHLQAYKSFPLNQSSHPKLPNSSTLFYVFYDHLNSVLGIQNSGTYVVHALNQWNSSSSYTLFDILISGTSVTQSQNRITAEVFAGSWTVTPCGPLTLAPQGAVGFGCPGNVSVYLNSHSSYEWNTAGQMAIQSPNWNPWCFCYPIKIDFLSVVLHEIGHVMGLDHSNSSTAVMRAGWHLDQTLTQDDKRGVTQIYGPYTDFEAGYALNWFPGYVYTDTFGLENVPAYGSGVSYPQLTRVGNETISPYTVNAYSGNKQIKLYGVANNNYSYAYMKLFSASDDELGSNLRHLTIKNGMTLSWYQFNHTQGRMSIDIDFTDGSTLRGSGLTDQYYITVHPAGRGVYSPGSWRYFTVNLSSLAGKTIRDVLIAYDNGNNGVKGDFRAYFDNIQINY